MSPQHVMSAKEKIKYYYKEKSSGYRDAIWTECYFCGNKDDELAVAKGITVCPQCKRNKIDN